MTPACDQCRYFHRRKNELEEPDEKPSIEGECRRHSPQVGNVIPTKLAHPITSWACSRVC